MISFKNWKYIFDFRDYCIQSCKERRKLAGFKVKKIRIIVYDAAIQNFYLRSRMEQRAVKTQGIRKNEFSSTLMSINKF